MWDKNACLFRKTGVGENINTKRSKGRTVVGIHNKPKGIHINREVFSITEHSKIYHTVEYQIYQHKAITNLLTLILVTNESRCTIHKINNNTVDTNKCQTELNVTL